MTTKQAISRLLWADKVEANNTEAALAHLVHCAVTATLPKNWQTLPNGKPSADTIAGKTIRLLQQINHQEATK